MVRGSMFRRRIWSCYCWPDTHAGLNLVSTQSFDRVIVGRCTVAKLLADSVMNLNSQRVRRTWMRFSILSCRYTLQR